MDQRRTYLAQSAADGGHISIGAYERNTHIHAFGATGTGKSTFLKSIIEQDIASGEGLLLIDPHGDLAEHALGLVPRRRTNQVCYLAPFELERPVAFNVLETRHQDDRSQVAEDLIAALRGIWSDSWGARMEDILRYSLIALLAMPDASLVMLASFLKDPRYRARVLGHCNDPFVRVYFAKEYDTLSEQRQAEWTNPILNKIRAFLAGPALRNVLGQPRSTLDLPHVMARSQIVIANLAAGHLGDGPCDSFGALLLGSLKTAAMARAKIPEAERRPFHLIVDEVQRFDTAILPALYSESRKFGLSITAANQSVAQLPDQLRAAVLGNAGTLAVFRVGPDDAEVFARKFQCDPSGLLNLETGHVSINGRFARTYEPAVGNADKARLKRQSTYRYGKPRSAIEARLVNALQAR